MRHLRGFLLAGLVPIGTLVGHAAGYAAAGEHLAHDGAHAYLGPGRWLAAAAGAAALGWIAAGGHKADSAPVLRRLGAGQMLLFFGMETVEGLASGHGVHGLLTQPSLRWGLAAQVVVAAGLVVAAVLARATGARVRALLIPRPCVLHLRPAVLAAVMVHRICSAVLTSPASPRGPPPSLVIA